ncbi:TPA: hypothetical protein HA251_05355 [Candidatus Woesearchaeota archaeon]|nr:hypothetical protein [Candidatus Woesearchaeota archaeon]
MKPLLRKDDSRILSYEPLCDGKYDDSGLGPPTRRNYLPHATLVFCHVNCVSLKDKQRNPLAQREFYGPYPCDAEVMGALRAKNKAGRVGMTVMGVFLLLVFLILGVAAHDINIFIVLLLLSVLFILFVVWSAKHSEKALDAIAALK